MKTATTLLLCACLASGPAAAQDDRSEGLDLMGRGLGMILRGLKSDAEPAIDGMTDTLRDLAPMLRDLAALVGDVRYYEAPERLPNGDILIRRKPDAPLPPPLPAPDDESAVDL